jgi:hypothetical protein
MKPLLTIELREGRTEGSFVTVVGVVSLSGIVLDRLKGRSISGEGTCLLHLTVMCKKSS